ncbi:hypothetical protein [Nitrosomonas sp.]|uniref:hypothetical protein n=1 Tax=Nitrosomonas sp. TaxID=42353 RepID=UPI00284069B0|nr:hypothetical protein [Nitrosomonas sp.]MDR4513151.1 hypothetical protein [Nitrosomonas sp.]
MQTRVSKEKITGIEFFPGKEGFQPSGKVHIEVQLDFTTKRKKGICTEPYSLPGGFEEAQSYFHLPTPFVAEVEWVDVAGGKRKILAFKPVQPVQQQKPAA